MNKKLKYIDPTLDYKDGSFLIVSKDDPQEKIVCRPHFTYKEYIRDIEKNYPEDKFNIVEHENIPECFIEDNGYLNEKYWEFLDALYNFDREKEAFIAYLNNYYFADYIENIGFDEARQIAEDNYIGLFDSEEQFAMDLVNDNGVNLGNFEQNFNYKALATDLFLNNYVFLDGYVFRDE